MATVSSSIQVSSSVLQSVSQSHGTGLGAAIYTAPSNGYAIVQVYGVSIATNAGSYISYQIAGFPSIGVSANTLSQALYLGPGTAIEIYGNAGTGIGNGTGNSTICLFGVEFKNG